VAWEGNSVFSNFETKWRYTPHTWDALDEVLGHSGSTPHLNWLAEKERIKQMSWWGEVATKVGLPADGQVYHLHPVGLVGRFHASERRITVAFLVDNEPGNVRLVTLAVNGGANGLHERIKVYQAIRKEWGLA
jgi:hypothetical protein